MALLLLMPAKGAWGQTEVTIGTGTDTQRYPLGNYFGYERGVALYTATDIGSAGNITRLSFYIGAAVNVSHPIKIYLKTQSATTLTTNTYASFTSGATLVYEADVSHPNTGWQDFNLTTPFAYDGTSSLLVIIETNHGGSGWGQGSSVPSVHYTTSTDRFLRWQQDNSIPTGNGTISANRPNIKLVIGGACTPKYTSSGDHITNFTLGTINNTTTYSTDNYSNYTNLSTTLMPGGSYDVSLTSSSGSGTHAAAIWIDFNDNGVFEESERVGMLDGIGASQTVTIPITIPTNAPSGSHTLRVIYQWNVTAENLDPCASATYGEGEDYTIIIPDCTLPTVSFPQSSYSHTIGGGGFTAPTLTNNGGTATYSSSNTAVATINSSTGAITIIGEGTTIITANTASTSTYCAGSASYTLNVVCPTMVAPTTTGASRCGAGIAELSASPGTNGNTCRWYNFATNGTLLNEGLTYNVNHATTTTYYVSTFNTETNCESSIRTPVTITIYPSTITITPSASLMTAGQTYTLTATGSANYQWTDNYGNTYSGSSINITALPGAVFTVTGQANGCDATGTYSVQTVDNTEASCGVIYVSPSGNDSHSGSSTQPVKTLEKALALAGTPTAANPVHIRLSSGTHNLDKAVYLKSNIIIDGQWDANLSTGVWTKGTTETTINRTSTNVEGTTTAPRLVALEANNIQNFTLQDLTVKTENAPTNLPAGSNMDFETGIIIGTGTSTSSTPLPGLYGNHRDASLYTADEIGLESGTKIMNIAYDVSSATTPSSGSRHIKIYIRETTAETIATGQLWATHISGATEVYSGNYDFEVGWNSIPVNYTYQGGNLVILIEGTGCTNSGGCSVNTRYTSATSKHAYHRMDGPTYNPVALTVDASRPNIRLLTLEPIGNGITTNSYTIPGWYEHHRDASLYTNDEINIEAGTSISGFGYSISSSTAVPSDGNERYVKVYVKETSSTSLPTGQTWATHISGATLVYSGNISTLNNYVDIPTNYIYQGENLIVLIEGTGCTTSGGCSVNTYSTTTSDNKHAYAVTDTDIYPTTTTLTANTTRPNIKIYTDNPQVTASNYGISTYALHIANSSGYNIERCKFQAGNASAGKQPSQPPQAASGAAGSGLSGGGSGGTATNGAGNGGAGGNGGAYYGSSSGNAYSGSQSSAGSAASVGGASGGGAQTSVGAGASNGNCNASSLAGSAGTTGKTGTSGSNANQTAVNSATYGSYFIPSLQGTQGNPGGGGSGGSGGGGGRSRRPTFLGSCSDNGGYGGKGGGGGAGGQGGKGGYGGDSSFGVYEYNSNGTVIANSYSSGSVGSGGSGGAGGSGGSGGNGATGGTSSSGNGGRGGNGGSGGSGGTGQPGYAGVTSRYTRVLTNGSHTNNAETSTIPLSVIASIDYGSSSKAGCTNSQIEITKTAGTWQSNVSSNIINDLGPEKSSYTTSSNTIITTFSDKGSYAPVSGSSQIFITQERNLGEISGNSICMGENGEFTYSGDLENGDYLFWKLYDENENIVRQYGTQFSGSNNKFNFASDDLIGENFFVKLEVKNQCCGISKPIWLPVTVEQGLIVGEISTTENTLCYGETPPIISGTEADGASGTYSYKWQQSTDGTNFTDISSATAKDYSPNNGLTADTWFRRVDASPTNCGPSSQNTDAIKFTVLPQFSAGAISTDGQSICSGETLTPIGNSELASGGNNAISYQWQKDGSDISGAILATYTPTEAGSYTRLAKDGECIIDFTPSTGEWIVELLPASVAGTVTSEQNTVCAGTTAQLSLSGNTGSIQWQTNASGTWQNIAEGTSAQYTTPNLIENTSYRAVVTSGHCPSAESPQHNINVEFPDIPNISGNDYVWTGAIDANWNDNTNKNWLVFENSEYYIPLNPPTETSNVHIKATSNCFTTTPIVSTVSEAKCNNITVESGNALIVNENGKLKISGNMLNKGSLSMNNNSDIWVKGNWTNSGTFNAGAGTLTFNGTNNLQEITTNGSAFSNVIFNNTDAGFELIGNTTILGEAQFSQGIIKYGNNGYLSFGENATSNGGTATSYVDGEVSKIGKSAFTFPVGNIGTDENGNSVSVWAPIGILAHTSSNTVKAQYFFTAPPYSSQPDAMCSVAELHHVSDLEHWLISTDNEAPAITLHWKDGERSQITHLNDLRIAHWDGTCWDDKGGASPTGDIYEGSITSSKPFTSYSPVTFGTSKNTNPLPVELLRFDVSCQVQDRVVSWSTATEINNDYFNIERSFNGITYDIIGQESGAGTTNIVSNYSFVDDSNHSGDIYYRITQVDFDGTAKTYDAQIVNCDGNSQIIVVKPNPFQDMVEVLAHFDNQVRIDIYNSQAKLVYSELDNIENSKQLHLQDLKPGVYLLKITEKSGKMYNFKIIKR